jgi:hypothetical protein
MTLSKKLENNTPSKGLFQFEMKLLITDSHLLEDDAAKKQGEGKLICSSEQATIFSGKMNYNNSGW